MSLLATGRRIVRPVAPLISSWEPAGRRGESKNTASSPARLPSPSDSPAHDPHEESGADSTRSGRACQVLVPFIATVPAQRDPASRSAWADSASGADPRFGA